MQAVKLLKRAREKEARKAKNRIRAQKRDAGELDDDDDRPQKKQRTLEFGARVVIDLGFDDKMTEKVGSLVYKGKDFYKHGFSTGNLVSWLPIDIHL